jgi:gliding motility-associated lipoprotein GldH
MEAIRRIARRIPNTAIGLLLIVSFVRCSTDSIYSGMKTLPEEGWAPGEQAVFHAPIDDTLGVHNVFVHVRHSGAYEYRNLFLFVTTKSPTGASVTDTLDVQLATPDGRWYGSGWGDLYDNKIPYKYQIRFPVTGEYTFQIVQGMRQDPLKHVTDIGLSIEQVEP